MTTAAPATAASKSRELVARIHAGDRAAESALVEQFARPIAILLDRHTNGRAEAQDLLQDTFRLALDKLRRGELRDPDRLPGFMAGLARNLAIDFYRTIQRRRTDTDEDSLERVETPTPSPLRTVLDTEKARLVRQLLGELTVARDREVLYRFYIAEDDRERIAADLGVDMLQLNRILYRARERYRELVLARSGGLHLVMQVLLLFGAIASHLVSLSRSGECHDSFIF